MSSYPSPRTAEEAISIVEEMQRRIDFNYGWQASHGGCTCTVQVAQVWFDGVMYLGSSKFSPPVKFVPAFELSI